MSTSTKALLASVSVLVLTMLHHAHGAAIYATPWRHHVAAIVAPVGLVLVVAHGLHRRRPSTALGRVSLWLFVVVAALGPVGAIGFFEGGYNHLVKNVLFFGGVSRVTFERLFPPPVYEAPSDAWFEVTGVLQLALGLGAARYLARVVREHRGGRARSLAVGVSASGAARGGARGGRP